MAHRSKWTRYRTVETGLWANQQFLNLSDQAKLLYLALRTGPNSSNVPGLWRVFGQGMAELLRWSKQRFARAFAELEQAGLAAGDWAVGVVFVSGVIDVDPPDNPDVIRGWSVPWSELPECQLKHTASDAFRRHCELRDTHSRSGEGFVAAFDDMCRRAARPEPGVGQGDGLGHGARHGVPDRVPHQDQELEPEQEQGIARLTGQSRVTVFPAGDLAGADAKPSARRHRANCAWSGRIRVPESLHDEFIRKLGGESMAASARLMGWYRQVEREWADRPIGDGDFEFWRNRFMEWVGGTKRPNRPSNRAPGSSAWERPPWCEHEPRCPSKETHQLLLKRDHEGEDGG